MTGKHRLDTGPTVPPWARVVVYVVSILAAFGGVVVGQTTTTEATTAALALLAASGPALAIIYSPNKGDDK